MVSIAVIALMLNTYIIKKRIDKRKRSKKSE
jgi:hypothetical protein